MELPGDPFVYILVDDDDDNHKADDDNNGKGESLFHRCCSVLQSRRTRALGLLFWGVKALVIFVVMLFMKMKYHAPSKASSLSYYYYSNNNNAAPHPLAPAARGITASTTTAAAEGMIVQRNKESPQLRLGSRTNDANKNFDDDLAAAAPAAATLPQSVERLENQPVEWDTFWVHNKVPAAHSNNKDDDGIPLITSLTNTNFDDFVVRTTTSTVLVVFYVPWCPHSAPMLQALQDLAVHLDDDNDAQTKDPAAAVALATVDCTVETTLCGRYMITRSPVVLRFDDGVFTTMLEDDDDNNNDDNEEVVTWEHLMDFLRHEKYYYRNMVPYYEEDENGGNPVIRFVPWQTAQPATKILERNGGHAAFLILDNTKYQQQQQQNDGDKQTTTTIPAMMNKTRKSYARNWHLQAHLLAQGQNPVWTYYLDCRRYNLSDYDDLCGGGLTTEYPAVRILSECGSLRELTYGPPPLKSHWD